MSLLTTDELAARWRCSERSIGDAIRRGDLAATKIGGRWLVAEVDVRTYEESRRNVRPVQRRTRRPRARTG